MQKRPNAEALARSILIVGILTLLGALFLLFTGKGSSSAEAQVTEIVQLPLMDRPRVQGNAMGDPDAPVKADKEHR